MSIKPKGPRPTKEEPFCGDTIDRKAEVRGLSKCITALEGEPFVIAIDAPWGSGKSKFLDMWALSVSGEMTVVQFNAWECDYVSDPLIPLLAKISEVKADEASFKRNLVILRRALRKWQKSN